MNQYPTSTLTSENSQPGSDSIERIVRIPSVERGCDGKKNLGRSYAKQTDRLAAKHGKKYGVYRCPHCQGTHLTTKLDQSENYAPLIHISEAKVELTNPDPKP